MLCVHTQVMALTYARQTTMDGIAKDPGYRRDFLARAALAEKAKASSPFCCA